MIVEYIIRSDITNYTKPAFNSLKMIQNYPVYQPIKQGMIRSRMCTCVCTCMCMYVCVCVCVYACAISRARVRLRAHARGCFSGELFL